jgi:hypothetical protein
MMIDSLPYDKIGESLLTKVKKMSRVQLEEVIQPPTLIVEPQVSILLANESANITRNEVDLMIETRKRTHSIEQTWEIEPKNLFGNGKKSDIRYSV